MIGNIEDNPRVSINRLTKIENDCRVCINQNHDARKLQYTYEPVRKESFNVCKDILHAGEGIMRGVTKASLRQKTTNNIPTHVVTKGAFLTRLVCNKYYCLPERSDQLDVKEQEKQKQRAKEIERQT